IALRLDEVRAAGFGIPERLDVFDGLLTAHSWVSMVARLGARASRPQRLASGNIKFAQRIQAQRFKSCGRDARAPRHDFHISWRFESALCIVTSSAYSRSEPTGTPIAMRVVRMPSGLSSFDK